jgi:predicted nucleotidyltransferase
MAVHEKEGKVSAPYIRDVLRKKDFEAFKKVVPEAAANRGVALKIFKMLSSKIVNEPTV